MTTEIAGVRGTKDLFGTEAALFKNIINTAQSLALRYNFAFAELPIFEFAEVFQRTMGATSDVIKKEIYSFLDRSGHELALRPEFTASIMRAVHSNKLLDSLPLKLFSVGPVFRYDRPQRCRQRQFNQINLEVIGADNLYQDVDVITLCMELVSRLQIQNVRLHINSLGNFQIRAAYTQALTAYLTQYKDDLSPESRERLEKNPLRILDTKDPKDKEILIKSPKIAEFYDNETAATFEKTISLLADNGIQSTVDSHLVRGLDYYDYTVFEIITEELGAQGTIIAGGRYNNLSTFFGKKQINCFGCAGGVERLMALTKKQFPIDKKTVVLVLGEENIAQANKIAKKIRHNEKICDIFIGKVTDLKKLLVKANKFQFNEAIIVGENEIKNSSYIVKDLDNGNQQNISYENIN